MHMDLPQTLSKVYNIFLYLDKNGDLTQTLSKVCNVSIDLDMDVELAQTNNKNDSIDMGSGPCQDTNQSVECFNRLRHGHGFLSKV